MIKAGKFIVILNFNTFLGSEDSLDEAQQVCRDHSIGCPRGHYEIFYLTEVSLSGTMGDQIKWSTPKGVTGGAES